VHKGHLFIAQRAQEQLELDEVIFIPAKQSPHKKEAAPTAAEHRVAMLNLACADYDWAEVSEIEILRESPSYSYLTAQSFADRFSQLSKPYTLYWIMGEDQWQALPKWKEPEKLASLVTFAVFTRNGESPQARQGYQLEHLSGTHLSSSTAIREAINGGKEPPEIEELDPLVAQYISNNSLYLK